MSLLDLTPPAWHAEAVCAQTDPEAFFPDKGEPTRPAKAICNSCPVRAECLDFAMTHGERYGIWGGVSERDRRRMFGEVLDDDSEPIYDVFTDDVDFTQTFDDQEAAS